MLCVARTAARHLCLAAFCVGKWEMGNGKWEMGNGKWGMGNGKWARAASQTYTKII